MSFLRVARVAEVSEGRLISVSTRYGRIALTRIGDEVLAFQGNTIEVLHRLHPIGVAMAGSDTFDPYKD